MQHFPLGHILHHSCYAKPFNIGNHYVSMPLEFRIVTNLSQHSFSPSILNMCDCIMCAIGESMSPNNKNQVIMLILKVCHQQPCLPCFNISSNLQILSYNETQQN